MCVFDKKSAPQQVTRVMETRLSDYRHNGGGALLEYHPSSPLVGEIATHHDYHTSHLPNHHNHQHQQTTALHNSNLQQHHHHLPHLNAVHHGTAAMLHPHQLHSGQAQHQLHPHHTMMMYGSTALGTFRTLGADDLQQQQQHHHQQQLNHQHHIGLVSPGSADRKHNITFDANKNHVDNNNSIVGGGRNSTRLDLTADELDDECGGDSTGYIEVKHHIGHTAKTELLELDDDMDTSYPAASSSASAASDAKMTASATASAAPATTKSRKSSGGGGRGGGGGTTALEAALDTDVYIKQEDARKVVILTGPGLHILIH